MTKTTQPMDIVAICAPRPTPEHHSTPLKQLPPTAIIAIDPRTMINGTTMPQQTIHSDARASDIVTRLPFKDNVASFFTGTAFEEPIDTLSIGHQHLIRGQ